MRCEVCGREILGPPQRKIIEGAKLIVCGRCAGFGKNDWSPRGATQPVTIGGAKISTSKPAPIPKQVRLDAVEAAEQYEFVEGYGALIRKARQKMGLTEKDLAMKMQEKESVVKKLEKEELTPDGKLLTKIRKFLGIEIIERVEGPQTPIITKVSGTKTIGDILKAESDKDRKD